MPSRRQLLALVLAAPLAACSDPEADGRRALIAFLNERVLDRPGLHVPLPSTDQAASFGPHAADYAIITTFHQTLDREVKAPLTEVMRIAGVTGIADVMNRRADFATARDGVARLRTAIEGAATTAEAAHAALRQPDDLKAPFERAYARLITAPTEAFRAMIPPLDEGLATSVRLGDLLDRNRAGVRVTGGMLQVANPQLLTQVQGLLAEMTAKGQAVLAAQGRLQALLTGG